MIAFFIALAYLAFCYTVIGLRSDHLLSASGILIAYYAHASSRLFVRSFIPYLLYWAVYDVMRVFPNYRYAPVHIADLYAAEKTLFGITLANGTCVTPCEYFAQHHYPLLDALGGLFYISWIPVPVAIAAYLWLRDAAAFRRFTYIFLGANFIGFFIYYLYPAAPPWYVTLHGFELHHNVMPNSAGLARFDAMFGVPLFSHMYGMGSNVFAAMPSLHSANPMALLLFGWHYFRRARWGLLGFAIGIWFSAVYLNHHYLLDVLGGIACAVAAYIIVSYARPRD